MKNMLGCLLVLLAGCVSVESQMNAVKVGALNPRPLIDFDQSKRSIALKIAPTIPDAFTVPQKDGVTAVPVSQWHLSLQNGFKNGPGQFFQKPTGKADYELSLVNVTLDYVPTAVLARGAQVMGAASAVARIRYIARVADKSGTIIARPQGEVVSTTQWSGPGGSSSTATEAIEAMYVDIGKKALVKLK